MQELPYDETERVIVWETPDYTASSHAVYLPNGEEMIFFHLDVYYMSADVLRSMRERWEDLRREVPVMLFCALTEETKANRRLVELFGFKFLRVVPCTDGKDRNLFVHIGPTQEAQEKQ